VLVEYGITFVVSFTRPHPLSTGCPTMVNFLEDGATISRARIRHCTVLRGWCRADQQRFTHVCIAHATATLVSYAMQPSVPHDLASGATPHFLTMAAARLRRNVPCRSARRARASTRGLPLLCLVAFGGPVVMQLIIGFMRPMRVFFAAVHGMYAGYNAWRKCSSYRRHQRFRGIYVFSGMRGKKLVHIK
jgi:hypothetical protein